MTRAIVTKTSALIDGHAVHIAPHHPWPLSTLMEFDIGGVRAVVLLAVDGASLDAIHRSARDYDEATWRAIIEAYEGHDLVVHAFDDAPDSTYRPHTRCKGPRDCDNAWKGTFGWRDARDWRPR